MYVEPAGFILFPLAIWLLWRASKVARFRLNEVALNKEALRLVKKSELLYDERNMELKKFVSDARKKIYKASLLILISYVIMFCALFFTIKTPCINGSSPMWHVALAVLAPYLFVFATQCIIPLMDLLHLDIAADERKRAQSQLSSDD